MDKINILIGHDGNKDIFIDAQKLVTGRSCVIAQSGAGKSYAIAVLCEELLKNKVPFCIIDTEGEYFSLREKYEILWVGGKKADISIDKVDMKKLAVKVISEGMPLIFDVSDVLDERKTVDEFTTHLYDAENEMRTPYLLMIEESDKFVPQSKESMKKIEEISRRGRKRGLGLLLATQRPALVNKNVLSQCGNQMIGKLTTENDLQAVNLFFGSRKELEELPELEPGEFFIMGDISKKVKTKIKQRETKHKGLTPILIPKLHGKISLHGLLKKDEYVLDSEEKKVTIRAVEPVINKGQAIETASRKRGKQFIFFGKKEGFRKIELQLHPLIYIELKRKEGILHKKYALYSFMLDGLTGDMVRIDNGLKYSKGFGSVLGLKDNELKVLIEIHRNDEMTPEDIAKKTRTSLKNVKTILTSLQKKNFVDYSKPTKSYVSLVDLNMPNIKHHDALTAKEVELDAKPIKAKISESDILNIVKAIEKNTEILKFEVFYYPIYAVSFETKVVNVDGITGKEV